MKFEVSGVNLTIGGYLHFMRAVLGNVADKYQKDDAEWLKMALEDEMEMQQFRSRVIGAFSSDQSFMRLVYRY